MALAVVLALLLESVLDLLSLIPSNINRIATLATTILAPRCWESGPSL